MKVEEELASTTRILLDTAPLIYAFERHPNFSPIMEKIFDFCLAQDIVFVTTPVTLAECLVHPYRKDLPSLIDKYQFWMLHAELTEFRPISSETAILAAQYRAKYNLRLTDAIQIAISIQSRCDAILTNDIEFKNAVGIRTIIINEIAL